jgi:prephenate dehydrogenase
VLARASARDALEAAGSLEDAVDAAELVVVAVPIGRLPAAVAAVLAATTDATVTDVGSTKASVVRAANGSPRFVGGHPICGSEARGPDHASAALFEGATWFLTPTAHTEPDRHRAVHSFATALGATPVAIDADAHDRLVAMTSHVPHVLANIVANQTGASRVEGHEPLAHAGGSLRDMTRIAGANPRIWVDIYLDNADAIRAALQEHRRRIEQVEAALEQGDAGFLARWIGEASLSRRRMLEREYPDPGALHRLRVHIPDRPGVFAGITQALGAERINIEDFEMHHISPERGGTLTLLVAGEDAANRGAALLESQGYSVVVSAVIDAD